MIRTLNIVHWYRKGKNLTFTAPFRSRSEYARIKNAVLARSRALNEPCVLPDKLLKRLDVRVAVVVGVVDSCHREGVVASGD